MMRARLDVFVSWLPRFETVTARRVRRQESSGTTAFGIRYAVSRLNQRLVKNFHWVLHSVLGAQRLKV